MANEGMRNLEAQHVKKIRKRIGELRGTLWTEPHPAEVALAETMDHLTLAEAKRLKYRPVSDGHRWGRPWGTGWFRIRARVPKIGRAPRRARG